ncbi:MAG: hypothetical protein ABEI98_01425, partial [Halorhabdus sp.]
TVSKPCGLPWEAFYDTLPISLTKAADTPKKKSPITSDVTTTYFVGESVAGPFRKWGGFQPNTMRNNSIIMTIIEVLTAVAVATDNNVGSKPAKYGGLVRLYPETSAISSKK